MYGKKYGCMIATFELTAGARARPHHAPAVAISRLTSSTTDSSRSDRSADRGLPGRCGAPPADWQGAAEGRFRYIGNRTDQRIEVAPAMNAAPRQLVDRVRRASSGYAGLDEDREIGIVPLDARDLAQGRDARHIPQVVSR